VCRSSPVLSLTGYIYPITHRDFYHIIIIIMSSKELKESQVDDLIKMSKEELLKLATQNWNNWIKSTV
jgi:hypothetical protein